MTINTQDLFEEMEKNDEARYSKELSQFDKYSVDL